MTGDDGVAAEGPSGSGEGTGTMGFTEVTTAFFLMESLNSSVSIFSSASHELDMISIFS